MKQGRSGIYKIVNLVNGKYYVGSAKYLSDRKSTHFKQLRESRHHNIYLQHAYHKYGRDSFEFVVIEYTSHDQLEEREQYWMDTLDVCNPEKGYNIRKIAQSNIGVKASEVTRQRMSVARMGKKPSEETKAKLSESKRKENLSEETIQKYSQWQSGAMNNQAKLDEAKVKEIKKLLAQGLSQPKIATMFGVSRANIGCIHRRETWSNV